MQFSSLLASASEAAAPAAEKASIIDALPHLLGMVMVFVTLAVLWGLCALAATLVKKLTPAPAPVTRTPAPAPKPDEPERLAPEIIAVITAAVANTVGKTTRIVSIRHEGTQWGTAGRQSVLTSHKIRK